VISPDGEYLGITKPPMGRITEIAGGKLLQNNRDPETGEATLLVYDIRPIVRGLDYPTGQTEHLPRNRSVRRRMPNRIIVSRSG